MSKMQNSIHLLLSSFLVLTQARCAVVHAGRESAVSVRGRILTNDPPPASCLLELYRKKGNRLVRWLEVPPKFERQFVVAPGVHEYYMVVSCPGSLAKVTTKVYKLGSVYYLNHPVDLGKISLKTAAIAPP